MSTTIESEGTRATVTESSGCTGCVRFDSEMGTADHFTAAETVAPAPVDITLTVHHISQDGEIAAVEDRHGTIAYLFTTDFTHDAEELNEGDTLLCHVLADAFAETELSLDDALDADPENQPTNYGTAYIKSESITVPLPLTAEEREEAGTRMASALSRKSQLEDQLDTFRKRINAQIKELDSEAAAASSEWLNGKSEQEVYCDVVADYDAGDIIWRNQETGVEVKRRPMTGEERQLRLPIPAPSDGRVSQCEGVAEQAELPMGETEAYDPDSARTCINCGHLAEDNTMDLPEACQTCRRGGNGDTDGWTERKECGSCMHSATPVDYPPCKTCQLNPQKPGKKDNWQGKDAAAEVEPTEEDAE